MQALRRTVSVVGFLTLLCPLLMALGLTGSLAEGANITVHSTVLGETTTYIGATEAGGLWANDLADLGINAYRLWTKMDELEWWDDDDAVDGNWDNSEYGTPTVAQIKADSASGFINTVPWAWWDDRFDETQLWRYGAQTRRDIITELTGNDVTPIIVLRTYDDQGKPEKRSQGATWAPRPPVNEAFRNEWWEHCFAIAYWLNVRNSYAITHFEVLNEPDYNCQGWCNNGCSGFAADFCGTQAEYTQLVLDAHDAISYANGFASLPVHLHAPVVASYSNPYVAYTLDNADVAVQVVDYHTYVDDVRASITGIKSTISDHNPDDVLEPIWVSEWGALWSSYDTLNRAMLTANQLLTFSEEEVEGVTVFNMYDWSTAVGEDYGLVDLQDDGDGGADRVYTESYYAYRLMTRGLVGGKERLDHTAGGFSGNTRTMVTRDGQYVYVLVLRNDVGETGMVSVDMTAIGGGSSTVTVWEYSAENRDIVVETPTMSAGQFSFAIPADGLSLARVDRNALAARLHHLTARTAAARPWIWLAMLALAAGIARLAVTRLRGQSGLLLSE
jgi:hypothetical protein